MPKPCGGVGGTPRPGADINAGVIYLSEIRQAAEAGVGFGHRIDDSGAVYIDPDEALEQASRLVPLVPPGAPAFVLDLMSFCENGPPDRDDTAINDAGIPGLRNIIHAALYQRWYDNCTCNVQPPTGLSGPIPIYPTGCDSWGKVSGYKRIPAEPPGMDYGPDTYGQEWLCEYRLFVGLPVAQPKFMQAKDTGSTTDLEYWAWYVELKNSRGERQFAQLTPTSPSPNPDHYVITEATFFPCPWCDVQPILPEGNTPDIPLPPDPEEPPPTIPGGPPVIILPPGDNTPTDCKFVELYQQKLTEAHTVLGPDQFPASLPETLFDPQKEGQKSLATYPDLLQWVIEQLDGLFGQFPVEINYKDANGADQKIEIQNQAEAMAEVIGLLIGIGSDTEIGVQLGMKGIVETIRSTAAATSAADYGKANAEFLGYRSKDTTSDLKLSISPGATNMKDALKESTKKIQRFEFADSADLQDYLRRLLIGVGIVKAAFYRPFNGLDDLLPGDRIRQENQPATGTTESEEDRVWREFLTEVETPPTRYRRDQNLPTVKIENVNTSESPNTSSTGS